MNIGYCGTHKQTGEYVTLCTIKNKLSEDKNIVIFDVGLLKAANNTKDKLKKYY